jgi:lipoprotein-anchoring transpeptidase ErfK/SrfK
MSRTGFSNRGGLAGGIAMHGLAGRVAGASALVVAVWALVASDSARADILVRVDKASQQMSVIVDGQHRYTWAVSTGIYGTPSGSFRPQALKRHHFSTLYNNAPMPYSIFYDGNFAIHGTTHVSRLGGPASRGCIRLHPTNAAVLFSLVQREGAGNTRITIQ